ncbi:MAG: sterol desaturase family protein [Mesorhizobium sp.]|uniref:sterol desaturase family protein n=1 Tax=Mesorhizobium sp. TaxID=1871066 RepID=UPI00122306B3|nr:sterol desaturase family protein [Mesorhizobium sp.]TIQ38337.1 MAG: sterol desaturase family protein [Mesorhizobium sp.]
MDSLLSKLPPVVLLLAFIGVWMWEGLQAARPGKRDWRRGRRNLVISLAGIVIGGLTAGGLLALASAVETRHWGLAALKLPSWIVVAAGVLLLDLTDYWRHRISHAVPVLWRLHRVHHSDPQMDVTTSFRSHPLEAALRPVFLGAAILAFGIPPYAVMLYPVIQLPVLIFQHANIALPRQLDRRLAWLIATPAMHVVHHSRWMPETNSNYSTFLTLWDRIFGSFRPSVPPDGIGLDGCDDEASQTVLGLLLEPLRPRPTAAGVTMPGNETAR